MDIVTKIENVEVSGSQPKKTVKITKSGELDVAEEGIKREL